MATTPPIVANTDFYQWQNWEQVTDPSGQRTYYVIPGYDGRYVFDPYASDATGRITIYENPKPQYDAAREQKDQEKKSSSLGAQLAIPAGALAGYGVKEAIAAQFATEAAAGAGAGASGAGTAAGTTIITEGAGGAAAAGGGASGAAALEAGGLYGGGSGAVSGGAGAGGGSGGAAAAGIPAGALAGLTLIATGPLWAPTVSEYLEKGVGKPITSAGRSIFGGKERQRISDESVLTSQILQNQLPGIGDLSPEQALELIRVGRALGFVKGDLHRDVNQDFSGQAVPSVGDLYGSVNKTFTPSLNIPSSGFGKHFGMSSGRREDPRISGERFGAQLANLGVDPIFSVNARTGESYINGAEMWERLPLGERIALVDKAEAAGIPIASEYKENVLAPAREFNTLLSRLVSGDYEGGGGAGLPVVQGLTPVEIRGDEKPQQGPFTEQGRPAINRPLIIQQGEDGPKLDAQTLPQIFRPGETRIPGQQIDPGFNASPEDIARIFGGSSEPTRAPQYGDRDYINYERLDQIGIDPNKYEEWKKSPAYDEYQARRNQGIMNLAQSIVQGQKSAGGAGGPGYEPDPNRPGHYRRKTY